MSHSKEIETLVDICCKELGIETVPFQFDLEEKEGKVFAKLLFDAENRPIQLSLAKECSVEFDLYYQIIKELRRAWQIQYRPNLLFGYKTKEEVGEDVFPEQKAEVDGHAYAAVVVMDRYHITPLFEGLSHKCVVLIRYRIEEIVDERDNPEYYEGDW